MNKSGDARVRANTVSPRRNGGASLISVMVRSLLALSLAMALVTVTPPEPASAAGTTYYVSPTGSDTAAGTQASPWKTIQKAANAISPGDTVHVAAGTYNERVTIAAAKSGTASAPTRFIADGAAVIAKGMVLASSYTQITGFTVTPGATGLAFRTGQVQVTGSHNTLTGLTIRDTVSGSAVSFQNGASANVLQNFTISRPYEFGIVFGTHSSAGGGYSTATYNTALSGTIAQAGGWAGVEMSGSYNTLDGVTVSGGPSGWNTRSQGVSSSMPYPDGDGVRVQGPGSTIRNCVIHDIWEWFHDTQHTDCIQFWTDADGLLIENCLLGTWEPGPPPSARNGLAQEIGPSQIIMAGTVPTGQNITYTVRNCLFLGQCGTNASIVSAAQSGASLKANLYNNTFWSSRPSLTPGSVLRNNIFRSFYVSSGMSLNSDYNIFCWVGGSGSNNVPASEGSHSLGRTYATAVNPLFVNPDVSSATNYGEFADFSLRAGSAALGRGDVAYAPSTDIAGVTRDVPPDVGAYESDGVSGPGSTLDLEDNAAGVTFDRFVPSVSSDYSGGTYTYGRWSGTRIEARFTGTGVAWVGPKQPSYGKADVYIDNVYAATVDCYAPDAQKTISTTLWQSGTLSQGTHTISIRLSGQKNAASSGTVVVVDGFRITNRGLDTVRVNDSDGSLTGAWVVSANSTYTSGSYRYSRWAGTRMRYTFVGTKIAWIGPRAANYGKADVYIDGVKKATVSQYGVLGWRYRVWESGTLSAGVHTIEIRVLGTKEAASSGALIVVDGFDVAQ